MTNRRDWYRAQCALFSARLGEWLEENPGRMTRSRKTILEAEKELGRNFRNDEEAYQSLIAIEEVIWSGSPKAGRVIFKSMRPSESFNKWLRDTAI